MERLNGKRRPGEKNIYSFRLLDNVMKRGIAFDSLVVAILSVLILVVIGFIFARSIGSRNKNMDDVYNEGIGKAKLAEAKAKCMAYCKEGNPDFFKELSELRPYKDALGLKGLHCSDIVDSSKCRGNINKIKKEVDSYYAT